VQLSRTVVCALALAACGGGGGGGGSPATGAPSRSGDLWEIDPEGGRAGQPAAALAYATGLHVLVVDGGDVWTGMTRLATTRGDGGARIVQLANGLSATLTPAGDSLTLHFSSGEEIAMHRREIPKGR
jgi:hypothetical protein